MSPHEIDVLEANSAFYRAFYRRDYDAMEDLWARRAPVACIHPGWNAILGREPVLASWQAILGNDGAPKIKVTEATAHVVGDSAYVICRELVSDQRLVATNVFVREDGKWRLVHHQAGTVAASADDEDETGPKTFN